jgi:hypothetical protein
MLAIGFAAAIHLLFLLLILTVRPSVSLHASPIVDLELAPRALPPEPRPSRKSRAPAPPRSAPSPTVIAPAPSEAPPPNAAPVREPPPSPGAPGASSNLGAILRGSVGCDFTGVLSSAEREACHERLAKGRSSDPGGALPAMRPEARAAFDAGARRDDWIHQPFLAEKPKNGCRPMVVHKDFAAPGAGQGHEDWTMSLACGKTF